MYINSYKNSFRDILYHSAVEGNDTESMNMLRNQSWHKTLTDMR
jgi:hypothetical protein